MGKDIKSLRTRIKSFDSTLHLTGAMGLVASSKIKRAYDAMAASREYSSAITDVTKRLASCPECRKSLYFGLPSPESDGSAAEGSNEETPKTVVTRLIVIAGDRGLCGGYNANVFRTVRDMDYVEIHPIGKRSFARYHEMSEEDSSDMEEPEYQSSEYYTYEEAEAEAKLCCEDFLAGKIDRVGIVYNRYVSIISQEPDVFWILPLERSKERNVDAGIFEPSPDELLDALVPEYFAGKLFALVKESFACEVAARRMAMDSAKKNAQQMIDDLTLEYNRARQGTITQEITEIVAGAGK